MTSVSSMPALDSPMAMVRPPVALPKKKKKPQVFTQEDEEQVKTEAQELVNNLLTS